MKITDLEILLLNCSLPPDYKHPTASFVTEGCMFLRVITDEGIYGLGEPSPYGGSLESLVALAENRLKPMLKGKDPFHVDLLTKQDETGVAPGYGTIPYHALKAAISQALWDILGKCLDMPVYRLLNKRGDYKKRIRAYASGGMYYDWQDPQLYVEEALKWREQGFSAWKLRPPVPDNSSHLERNAVPPAVDIPGFVQILERVRYAVGSEMELMVDFGCRLGTVAKTVEFIKLSKDLGIVFIEEPLPRVTALHEELQALSDGKIAGGECLVTRQQFHEWQASFDVFQPDANLAGISEIIKIAEFAQSSGKIS